MKEIWKSKKQVLEIDQVEADAPQPQNSILHPLKKLRMEELYGPVPYARVEVNDNNGPLISC